MNGHVWRIIQGDALEQLRLLSDRSVQTCITSPPYFGLRDYGTGSWEGGDESCDHVKETPIHADPTSTLGVPADGGPRRIGDENATVVGKGVYRDVCGKCGARRIDNQLGLESTPDEYVARLVEVFREVRRVLRDDGTLWLNLGDSYAANAATAQGREGFESHRGSDTPTLNRAHQGRAAIRGDGIKPKDLLGIPWMVAFALRADGWYLRSDIVWAKPNPMPESVTDRPTKAHEYVFLLSKGPRYFYDDEAIKEHAEAREPGEYDGGAQREADGSKSNAGRNFRKQDSMSERGSSSRRMAGFNDRYFAQPAPFTRNKRSVWTVPTQPFPGAHFAVFPPKLIEPCVLAGSAETACGVCGAPWERVVESDAPGVRVESQQAKRVVQREGWIPQSEIPHGRVVSTVGFQSSCDHQDKTGTSTVLDPFAGAGTTGVVATRHNRSFIGIELNSEYAEMARERIRDDAPLMNYLSEDAA